MFTPRERRALSTSPAPRPRPSPPALASARSTPVTRSQIAQIGALAGNQAALRAAARPAAPGVIARSGMAEGEAPLPHLATIQRCFGRYDVRGVGAHQGARAQAATAALDARALAHGERVAFSRAPDLGTAAHEAVHVLQQRSGLRLAGGLGRVGDRHEALADDIAGRVRAGQSVESRLDVAVGPRARRAGPPRADAPVQRLPLEVGAKARRKVQDRIAARKGEAVELGIGNYTGDKATALAALHVASMANDPIFEMVAQGFEERLGAYAHEHPRARDVCQRACQRILRYYEVKHTEAKDKAASIDDDLARIGMGKAAWSGAVGKAAQAIRRMLTEGSVGERVAHIEAFVRDELGGQMIDASKRTLGLAGEAGFDSGSLGERVKTIEQSKNRWWVFDMPEGKAYHRQWHGRVEVKRVLDAQGDGMALHHPSSVKGDRHAKDVITNPSKTVRPRARITGQGLGDLKMKLGPMESRLQDEESGRDALAWEEGARIWMLNELDAWVYQQRQLSLPLASGASGTAERVMQAFEHLGIHRPDDARLAIIGALVPTRHHALVEVMYAAEHKGASPYRKGAKMYRDIEPLTHEEVAENVGPYPDEVVDPKGLYGGYRRDAPGPDLDIE